MALLPILQFPDQQLKLKASLITTINDEIKELAKNMLETMYENNGVGLAATQVNSQKSMFVMDCSNSKKDPLVLINPEILNKEAEIIWEEGCLSFPGIYVKIKRASRVTVKYLDLQDEQYKELTLTDLPGICVQHEKDHLDGIVFFDHLSILQKNLVWEELLKNRKKRL